MRRLHAFVPAMLILCLISTACGGGAVAPTPTPTTAMARTPTPLATATPVPVASLDPGMTAEALFADDTPAAELGLEERSREAREGALIRDVRYLGADGRAVPAYLIGPADGSTPKARVLFLHWLGENSSSRDEFVAEAVALAGKGVESMLITQRFPWSDRPSGVDHDRVAIGFQVRTIRRALTLLDAEVGSAKLAIVGHDYGCMHGILAASVDDRPAAVACITPDSTWANWFVRYFHVVDADGTAGYAQAMADLDPVSRIGKVEAPLLLQFATNDVYVSADVAAALTEAAPGGTDIQTYDADHRLDEAARTDHDAWLLKELGIGS